MTEFGDTEFRTWYFGRGPDAFLTQDQAAAYEGLIKRVEDRARHDTAGCVGTTLEECLSSLARDHFVTSQAFRPIWIPGDLFYRDATLQLSAYPVPVMDKLGGAIGQLDRRLSVRLVIGRNARVRELWVSNVKVGNGSRDQMMSSTLRTLLKATFPDCLKSDVDVLAVAQRFSNIPMDIVEDGVAAKYGRRTIKICHEAVWINRYRPTERLGQQALESLSFRWLEGK